MRKKLAGILDRWGHYALAVMCVGVIVLSALWTKDHQAADVPDAPAIRDESQRLADVTPPPDSPAWTRPAYGAVLRAYSEEAAYFPETGVWQAHPALDFAAEAGETVYAMAAGSVRTEGEELWIDHGDGWRSRYRGLAVLSVRNGQTVRAGDPVGKAGGRVLYEGAGHVCVAVFSPAGSAAFGRDWLTNK